MSVQLVLSASICPFMSLIVQHNIADGLLPMYSIHAWDGNQFIDWRTATTISGYMPPFSFIVLDLFPVDSLHHRSGNHNQL